MSAYSQFGYAYPTTGGQQVSEPVLAVRRYKKNNVFFSDTLEHVSNIYYIIYLFIVWQSTTLTYRISKLIKTQ